MSLTIENKHLILPQTLHTRIRYETEITLSLAQVCKQCFSCPLMCEEPNERH